MQPESQSNRKPATGGLTPIKPADFGYAEARHLLWRAGFGGTPAQIQKLVSWGPERSVTHLLEGTGGEGEPASFKQFDRDIMRPPSEEERAAYAAARKAQNEDAVAKFRAERQIRERQDRQQMAEIQKWWLKRMIESARPLEEKMTLFWHGLLATSYRTIENSFHMLKQNELYRANATGNFGELLFQLIRDPAMLAYLDNNDSRKGRANENLAREIMELFALGIGNYSEKDIKEGARALTGYTFVDDEFVFQKNNHDAGEKTILGKNGNMDGDDFVRAILAQKACAQYLARRVYAYFCSDVPPDERGGEKNLSGTQRDAIRSLAASLLASKYDIKPMLEKLFLSEHFYSPAIMNEQIKSPVVLVVGAVRSLNCPPRDLSILNDAFDLMGQNLFYPPSVKGWEGGRSWINTSTLFVRQNIMAFLLTGKKPQGYDATADTQRFDPVSLISELSESGRPVDPATVVEYLLRLTLGHAPSHAQEPLLAFLKSTGDRVDRDTLTGLLLLITSMPEYQLC
ncbi:MAG: DUF1800 domain-containing protein [Phycisphaerales bacterium]